MDSRVVNRGIRREVWPALRERGFDLFTARSAWRRITSGGVADQIWLVNFQSFNDYFAQVDGCTTFSFCLNLAIYIRALGATGVEMPAKPNDYQCHFRGKLSKTIVQRGYARPDIWYVDPEGLNVLDVLHDARAVLLREGMTWFERFRAFERVLDVLVNEPESDTLFGFGRIESPIRKQMTGRALIASGKVEAGTAMLRQGENEIEAFREGSSRRPN
jgi:hypothetical protein